MDSRFGDYYILSQFPPSFLGHNTLILLSWYESRTLEALGMNCMYVHLVCMGRSSYKSET